MNDGMKNWKGRMDEWINEWINEWILIMFEPSGTNLKYKDVQTVDCRLHRIK